MTSAPYPTEAWTKLSTRRALSCFMNKTTSTTSNSFSWSNLGLRWASILISEQLRHLPHICFTSNCSTLPFWTTTNCCLCFCRSKPLSPWTYQKTPNKIHRETMERKKRLNGNASSRNRSKYITLLAQHHENRDLSFLISKLFSSSTVIRKFGNDRTGMKKDLAGNWIRCRFKWA